MKIEFTIELETVTCDCGIQYAVPASWREARRRDHKTFYCPNGCRRHFPGESDIEKAQRESREKQAALNEANHLRLVAERARDAAIAEKSKLEARISAGVCPCCKRTFSNLARHMTTKHKGAIGPGRVVKMLAADSGVA